MKKTLATIALAVTATTSIAGSAAEALEVWKPTSLESFAIGPAPKPTDKIDPMVSDLTCEEILPQKGWIRFTHPNTNYQKVFGNPRDTAWVKGDKLIDCEWSQLIFIYDKLDVDSYVNRLTKHQEDAKKKKQETFVNNLDKL